jgi:hypothetical protein
MHQHACEGQGMHRMVLSSQLALMKNQKRNHYVQQVNMYTCLSELTEEWAGNRVVRFNK